VANKNIQCERNEQTGQYKCSKQGYRCPSESEDDSGSRNRVTKLTRSGKEELAVSTTVLTSVLETDVLEALANSASGLISSKDTLASSDDSALEEWNMRRIIESFPMIHRQKLI